MLKRLIRFTKNTCGTVLIIFGLASPILLIGFAYMNNFAIWNDLYQSTKGASKAAAQSLGKQFFSQCVASGNNLSNCANAGTAANIATNIMEDMIQAQIDTNYPLHVGEYTINVTIVGTVDASANFIQIPTRVQLTGFDDQIIAPAMFGTIFPDIIEYDIQTVINIHFFET